MSRGFSACPAFNYTVRYTKLFRLLPTSPKKAFPIEDRVDAGCKVVTPLAKLER